MADDGPYEFDEVDEPATVGCREPGPSDTREVQYRDCEVCGLRIFYENHDVPPRLCPRCDETMAATVADLVLNARAQRREKDDV